MKDRFILLFICLCIFGGPGPLNASAAIRQYSIMTCKLKGQSNRGSQSDSQTLKLFTTSRNFTSIYFKNKFYEITRVEQTPSSNGDMAYIVTARHRNKFIRLSAKRNFQIMQTTLKEGFHSKKNADVVTTSATLICRNDLKGL